MPRPARAQANAPTRQTTAPSAIAVPPSPPRLTGDHDDDACESGHQSSCPQWGRRSSRNRRASTATKNGALFSSTDATAAPASRVPSEIAISVIVMFPAPSSGAHAHPRAPRGNLAPASRSTGSMIRPPASARATAISAGLVRSSAVAVTGYASPAKTIDVPSTASTGTL